MQTLDLFKTLKGSSQYSQGLIRLSLRVIAKVLIKSDGDGCGLMPLLRLFSDIQSYYNSQFICMHVITPTPFKPLQVSCLFY